MADSDYTSMTDDELVELARGMDDDAFTAFAIDNKLRRERLRHVARTVRAVHDDRILDAHLRRVLAQGRIRETDPGYDDLLAGMKDAHRLKLARFIADEDEGSVTVSPEGVELGLAASGAEVN